MEDIKDDKQELEKEIASEPSNTRTTSNVGPIFRAARKDKAMTINDVSKELNLSFSIINDIENDSWENLPEATYIRGYIRSYANLLGLNPDDVLTNFRYSSSEQNISLDSMPRKIENRKIEFLLPKKVKILLVSAAIFGVLVYLYKYQSFYFSESKLDQIKTYSNQGINDTGKGSSDPSKAINTIGTSTTIETPTKTVDASPSTSQNSSDELTDELTTVTAELKELLELEFNSTSWVDIRDKEGKKLIYKSFPPGEKTSVKTALPIYLFIGNADAVTMHYQGQVIDLQQYKEEGYAKFTFGE